MHITLIKIYSKNENTLASHPVTASLIFLFRTWYSVKIRIKIRFHLNIGRAHAWFHIFYLHHFMTVVFKLCATTLWGAVRNSKGVAIFFWQFRKIVLQSKFGRFSFKSCLMLFIVINFIKNMLIFNNKFLKSFSF